MLSDTLQHADLNAALQPYYSEMRFDTFSVSPAAGRRWGKGGGGGKDGGGRKRMDGIRLGTHSFTQKETHSSPAACTFKSFPLVCV